MGNIFVGVGEGGKDICLLGGYENTLLGFQPSHRVFAYKEYSSAIDLMMFGKCTCCTVELVAISINKLAPYEN